MDNGLPEGAYVYWAGSFPVVVLKDQKLVVERVLDNHFWKDIVKLIYSSGNTSKEVWLSVIPIGPEEGYDEWGRKWN